MQAVQYLQNHSASPMESRLYMLLCLPNSLGGCGFPKAILNHPVKVDSKQFYIDLYFPSASLGIEYDSYEYHSNAKAFSQDTLRDAKLRTAGYRLIHVKPGQLREIKAFQDLITIISRILAKQVYIRTSKFFEPFSEIFHNFKAPAHVPVRRSDFPYFGGAAQAYEKYLRALE
ncbi:MAG: hypothetical protein Q4D97_02695 [Eubacteriales bacterium]|nr:hypothetical protein [Eubacteriales bacterium]